MEKYPWISFEVNLKSLPCETWVQLGECFSKCEHIARIPLQPSTANEMHKIYLAKGVLATTAIEGNTLTEDQVKLIIDKKLTLPPSKQYLKQEVDNILELCNEIIRNMASGKPFLITIDEIRRYNKIILQNVPIPDHVIPGEFRTYPVGVGSYKAIDHNDVPELMKTLCEWLNSSYFQTDKKLPDLISGIIKSIIAHLYIEWIHPFGDGNGRVGRILEYAILLYSGVPSPAAHLLSNHYNATRNEYYIKLDSASKKKEVCEFISYAVQGFRDNLMEQLQYIFDQILYISWQSFVYETFKGHKRSQTPAKRMIALVLELSHREEPVARENLIAMTPAIIDLYKTGSSMMLTRDLNELTRLDLIEKTPKGYKAKIEKMHTFLPSRVKPNLPTKE